jgi:hypothetical protein
MMWLLAWLGAQAAEVEGRVLQKGDAKPLADVVITLADGSTLTTDVDGRFTVDLPDAGETLLVLTSSDHRVAEVTVTTPFDKPLRLFLTPLGTPGEIVVEAFRPTPDLSRHHVDAEMAWETPGTLDDAVRLVQALPGVNIQREYAPSSGEVSVRGSLPGDNRYYYDGIEIPYLYHFNQYASVFPASDLKSLDLYPSTFGAQYGDSVGAVIEAVSDRERPDDVTGQVSINFVTLSGAVKAPLPKKWWIGVSARRSFQDIVERGTEQFPLFPRFYDFNVRAQHGDADKGTGIFVAGAGDRYDRAVGELDILDPVENAAAPELTFGRDYQLMGVRHHWRRGRVVSAVLHDRLLAELNVPGRLDQRTLGIPTRVDVELPLVDKLSLDVGGEFRPEVLWLDLQAADLAGALVAREAPALAWRRDVDRTLFRGRLAAYSTLHAALGPVRLMPGVRVGIDSFGWAPTIEPRLSARLRVAEQTELRLAGGRYQQRPDTFEAAALEDLPTTSSWQVGGGLDQTIANRLEISVEGYGRFLDDLLVQHADGPPEVFERGQSYGAELTLRYRMRETFFAWAWFAYGRSFAFDSAGERISTDADQPFSGGLVVSWNILPPLNLALRYRVASGLPYTQIDGSTYDAVADTWIPRFDTLSAERLPLYQKIDIHLAYEIAFKRWALSLAADVWIVPKTSAQLYPTWNYDFTEQGFVLGPTILPLLTARATF